VLDTYKQISQALLRGCSRLGIEASLERAGRQTRPGLEPVWAKACFASAARYEVIVGGRKLIGSAQRRQEPALLQHGSIPLIDQLELLSRLVGCRGEAAAQRLTAKATNLTAAAGRPITFEDAFEAFRKGFQDTLGPALAGGCLSPVEQELLSRALQEEVCGAEEQGV
jgi:lipoate-protein ligase A